ncbi:MAG: class I SAM-dependent methyltransferase [Hapalosiphonaceae cyanobacterium JJU2]|nr:MAG: class I SAM-dependent methyltransferase [Hapalosiphonaceae cyanobacterium JJU2]
MDSHSTLCAAIRDRITNSPDQRITFTTYMDMALYHPDYGYYSTEAVNIGKQGDFFTSVHLGPDFGELLAEQFVQMWEILGQPAAFSLVEMGAGQGHLALDILNYLKLRHPNFFAALKYIIVEKSPILRQQQQQRLQEFTVEIKSNLEEILSNSIIGCFFSNELVDALPVHQFILEQGQLREIYVTLQQESIVNSQRPPTPFTEIIAEPSTPRLAEYFDLVGIQFLENVYPEGYRSEVNLAALDWLGVVADRLQRGYVLTIDYGYPASRYYNPRRSQGTLQCYWHHQRHNNPYINIGRQDITAHVDFTALERWGERCGLAKVGWTQQELFLMALGLGDHMVSLSHTNQPISDLLRRRDALRQLLDPFGLGGFGVLAQSKGLKETEKFLMLKGFTVPQLPTSN